MALKYFGEYVLNDIIGGGGYTKIYKAHCHENKIRFFIFIIDLAG